MGKNIEKKYKKRDSFNVLDKFYWRNSMFVGIILMCLYYFFNVHYIAILVILVFSLVVILFFSFRYSGYYSYATTNKVLQNIKECIVKMREENIKTLIKILKEENVNTKEDIKILIDYYSLKLPLKIKSSTLQIFISGVVTFASFITIFVNENSSTIDSARLTFVLTIVLTFAMIWC